MNEFDQLEEPTQNIPKHYKLPKANPTPKLHNYYNQLQSQLSANPDDLSIESKPQEDPQVQQFQKNAPKFKLVLPPLAEPDDPQERNNTVKAKKVLIEPTPSAVLRQSGTAEKLKIYDLEDEVQEEINQNLQYTIAAKPQRIASHPQFKLQQNVLDEHDNSFLVVQEKINQNPYQHLKKQQQLTINASVQEEQNVKSRLFTKIEYKQVPKVIKGEFVDKTENDDYTYMFKDTSKQTLDSGLQVTSVYSSRDELSTRNILLPNLPQRSRRNKLPQLKPYKQVLTDKAYQVPSQTLLKQPESVNNSKKMPKMVRSRQKVIKGSQITDVPSFVRSPVSYGSRLQCILKRNKNGCKRFYLDYDLATTDGKFLMSCKKMPFNINSTYNISLANGAYQQKGQFYLGKVKGNFSGSIFNMYAYNPDSFEDLQMVATIYYNPDCSCCSDRCRQLQIYLKHNDTRYYELSGTELQKGKNLKDLYEISENQTFKRISKYVNKQAKWMPEYQMYSLNFHQKAKYPSVKNTIIVKEGKPDQEVLLIAKQSENQFAFEVSFPFSPSIALGVMITGFDFKLASQ